MQRFVFIVVFTAFFSLINSPTADAEYWLAAGDVLQISVWEEEELTVKDLMIRPDGNIDFPVIGEIQAAGIPPGTLARSIAARLKDYVVIPKVTVNIMKYHTIRIYVLGEVNKPGTYEIEKQHNLLDAIGAAGGYTKDAAKKKVFIIPAEPGRETFEVNLLQLLKTGDKRLNVSLHDGDTVYLGSNNRINFDRDILPFITGVYYIKDLGKD